ncbi:tetratricopeptide repeat protein [Rhodoplanes sp. TEM]|uniref:Tetratricopeptide repeat protein 38 n=1 Tax=Rhodoplanes tepidamans TaxID=200616 RepID=A0ABT5J875_RHOTP|nr:MULTISPECIES: tetratricopeptide repeat protein [Rhodoplanes]MDC7785703.1 tetratricopeptide repeat protein [Rhodoplanes tepidamans]MDC7983344.1 tetratricopeptide repeat protein [Rhodoplanes sp. TEM]MDQ0354728.1 tetratricopeptide (TPR) repeat protein [Rhodoplanes tepidamans]
MTVTDIRGHRLGGASEAAARLYDQAVGELALFRDDPVATVDAALADSPDFVMAHALRAWLHLLGTEPAGVPVARAALAAARDRAGTEQERGHLAAIAHLADARWHAAARVLEDVAIAHPRDLLALQAGHQLDFFRGDARMLRDRIARARPAWSPAVPGHHAVLGMAAFGLEETGAYAEAERAGRAAVEAEPRDAWARHAVAHVMEMQGRHDDGIAWMSREPDAWADGNFLAVHNWWHLALYHLERGEIDAVLDLYDGPIRSGRSGLILDMIDAAAMLWRLHLRGIDVGPRFAEIADAWEPVAEAGLYAFNDVHAVMAFVGAGRPQAVARVVEAQRRAMEGPGDNAAFTREVGAPVVQAMVAFGDGRWADTVRLLRPVRGIAHRFGGSHAQRDVIDLTLIEAALRDGDAALAAALAAERAAAKPESPLARLFAARATALRAAA